MLEDCSRKFSARTEKRMWKSKLEADLKDIDERLVSANRQLEVLTIVLSREEHDLQQLEGMSMRALFATILGSKEEQTQKERQEFLQAQMQTRAAQRQISTLQEERTGIIQRLDSLQGLDEDYRVLLDQKEEFLRTENESAASALLPLDEELARTQTLRKEVSEAATAASAALAGLDSVIDSLQSARSWGTWDLLGGDLLTTVIKHDRMDDARQASEQVQGQLNRLLRELKDISTYRPIEFDMAPLEYFGDLLLDGLLFDWLVQSKILRSLEQTGAVRDHVSELNTSLIRQNRDLSEDLSRLASERQGFIERS